MPHSRVKLQHYVPRLYLKAFCILGRGNRLYCFNKMTSKDFPVNIRNIASETHFYDTPKDTNQTVEKALATIEDNFNVAYTKLINLEDLTILDDKEKTSISYFVATQELRTRENRAHFQNLFKQLKERLSKENLSETKRKELDELNTEEGLKSLHVRMFEHVPMLAEILLKMNWVLYVNITKLPLLTSDNPVCRYNPYEKYHYGNMGLLSKGIQIHFPLSPKLELCMLEPESYYHFPYKEQMENEENVIFCNSLQVVYSYNYLFSNLKDFSLAKTMISKNRELANPHRKRIIAR